MNRFEFPCTFLSSLLSDLWGTEGCQSPEGATWGEGVKIKGCFWITNNLYASKNSRRSYRSITSGHWITPLCSMSFPYCVDKKKYLPCRGYCLWSMHFLPMSVWVSPGALVCTHSPEMCLRVNCHVFYIAPIWGSAGLYECTLTMEALWWKVVLPRWVPSCARSCQDGLQPHTVLNCNEQVWKYLSSLLYCSFLIVYYSSHLFQCLIPKVFLIFI